jgi:hypothetical protein
MKAMQMIMNNIKEFISDFDAKQDQVWINNFIPVFLHATLNQYPKNPHVPPKPLIPNP